MLTCALPFLVNVEYIDLSYSGAIISSFVKILKKKKYILPHLKYLDVSSLKATISKKHRKNRKFRNSLIFLYLNWTNISHCKEPQSLCHLQTIAHSRNVELKFLDTSINNRPNSRKIETQITFHNTLEVCALSLFQAFT